MPLPHFLPAGDGTVDPGAVVAGEQYRISVLSPGLLRLEHSPTGRFEDRPSAFAVDRRFPVPDFQVRRTASGIELLTERIHLSYDERAFSPTGLSAQIRGGVTSYHSVWRYGTPLPTLGGTARTLDNPVTQNAQSEMASGVLQYWREE